MPTEKPRITITVTDEERAQIEEYWHNHKLKNQTQAILSLVKLGLDEVNRERLENGEVVLTDARQQLMCELFSQLDDTDKADLYRHGQLMLLQRKYKSPMPIKTDTGDQGRLAARGGVTAEQERPADMDAFLQAIDDSAPPEKV